MSGNVNNAGRGFNVAVLNSSTKKVTSVNVFDTYEKGMVILVAKAMTKNNEIYMITILKAFVICLHL